MNAQYSRPLRVGQDKWPTERISYKTMMTASIRTAEHGALALAALLACGAAGAAAPLIVPAMTDAPPGPGRRVRVTPPEYAGTDVHHSLYLPDDWTPGGRRPVIVEYTGNYFPTSGSTGEVGDAHLGFGLSAGTFIWVVLPFVGEDGRANARTWWGDEAATVAYCKTQVPRICREFGGDPDRVFLCGFSRGAIAVNYIGLHDDDIAALWRGLLSHDHYDGVKEWRNTAWGSPLDAYQAGARTRAHRLRGRPVLIMQNGSTQATRRYLDGMIHVAAFTFLDVPVSEMFPDIPDGPIPHPHTDRWPLFPHDCTTRARAWLFELAR